ncbi:MAG: type I DNA topoisomerase [Alphaproteobacteria bacterium]|nr:type I DNA topoisomerase [Alphaproteobacteria bacterium]MBP7759016.1 type I DNA topoisomerase [Alphaproteobacteria bacterium]MBP7762290.1 type I DNA topoisomerase [Alphaproteobacteria bacterium]MBP7905477.1 type I DNA topoisomerase [Alphaproteobacteria bacterium]
MSAPNLVIVESPAKAKTIHKYLGPDFEVIASYGHVRDLVNKDGSVLPDENFKMKWQLGERAEKNVREIKRAVKSAKNLYLAPDPDREGEAIAWHIQEILNDENLLEGKNVKRVTFNEITKSAVQEAFSHPRELDVRLIDAYLARRALDYLVGFNLSPVLWRKLPGSRSAGRVQSVALRLICEREAEIEKFITEEYWSIEARLRTPEGAPFTARLTHLAGNKLDKMDIGTAEQANLAVERIRSKNLSVQKIEKKQARRFPAPPFITSSLQMEASRKLGMSASQTMRTAQNLYEDGYITYMRTDGTTLSDEAVQQCRSVIKKEYGDKFLPDAPRLYKSKAKNAQEAHEAIRPTNLSVLPGRSGGPMQEDQRKLYELIWKRTIASQMENAVLEQVKVDLSEGTDDVILRANGSVILFPGFLTLYQEDTDDDKNESEDNRILPPMQERDATKLVDVTPNQHFTQPPPRYSEASLVKRLEELGIGRPSTYASILQVLRDRNYVKLEKRRFIPEDRGRLVTTFLAKFFAQYVDYGFTANLEEELDAIASGHVAWKEALKLFWRDFKTALDGTKELTITNVIDHLDEELGPHFFPPEKDANGNSIDPKKCKACAENAALPDGKLGLRLGKFGAFIGCSNYPECKFTRPLIVPDGENGDGAALANEPKILGTEPGTGRTVSLRRGPYGPYVQIDPAPELAEDIAAEKAELKAYEEAKAKAKEEGKKAPKKPKKRVKPKPKRQGLPKGLPLDEVTLEGALKLLALPRDVGTHPETGLMIQAGIGRFGPFLKHADKFTSLPKDDDVLFVGMNRAVEVLALAAEKAAKREAEGKKPFTRRKTADKKPAGKKKSGGSKKKASAKKSGAAEE